MFSSSVIDYPAVFTIANDWYNNSLYSYESGGRSLLKSIGTIQLALPNHCITDTSAFGDILTQLEGKKLLQLMEMLLAHISNPNFILESGKFQGLSFLQGAIALENKELIKLIISGNHGSKIFKLQEPLLIDDQSAKWIKENL